MELVERKQRKQKLDNNKLKEMARKFKRNYEGYYAIDY